MEEEEIKEALMRHFGESQTGKLKVEIWKKTKGLRGAKQEIG